MTERDKISIILETGCNSIEELLFTYIAKYPEEFKLDRLLNLIDRLNRTCFYPAVLENVTAMRIAKERATYLKAYLEGKLYTSREASEEAAPIQAANAQAIIDACKSEV